MPSHIASLSLSGGEISPLLYNRIDMEKRASAVALCENFLPLPYGGVRKRPGTKFLLQLTAAVGGDFMIPFRGSDGKRYILIFTTTAMLAYDILAGTAHSVALNWGLDVAKLPQVRSVALNDVLFFTHPEIHPFSIRYTSATSWEVTRTQFEEAPELDQNLEENALIAITNQFPTEWTSGASVSVGNFLTSTINGVAREYTCTVAHTSSATNRPGIGATWRNFWTVTTYPIGTTVKLTAFPGMTTWSGSAVSYKKGAFVSRSGVPYRCLIPHTSDNALTPGAETAATLGSYWRRLAFPFDSLQEQGAGTYDNTFRPAASFSLLIRRDERSVVSELRAIVANDGKFSTPILISGPWTFNTFDTWSGIFTLERSLDNGTTWETIGSYESEQDRNYAESFEEETAALIRLGFVKDANTNSGGNRRGVITPSSATVRARVNITDVANGYEAFGTVQDLTMSGSTYRWAENAFNRRVGFPRAIAIHERRLYYAGTARRPLDLWASRIEDFSYFRTGTADDDPLKVTLGAFSQNPILWMASQRRLFIGTRLSEWVIGSENNDNPITPTNFIARQYTTYGSSETVRPLLVGDSVIFLQRHDARVRELGYSAEREAYDAADLTRLAEHMLLPDKKITSMAWQESREPTLWCTVSDGTLRSLTYIRAERVFAWARHSTGGGGQFTSVAVSTTEGNDDEVYFIALRAGTRYLEVLPANAQILNDQGSILPGVTLGPNCPAVFDHQTTASLNDGATFPTQAGWNGAGKWMQEGSPTVQEPIILYTPGTTVPEIDLALPPYSLIGGIPVTAQLLTLPLEMQTQNGPSLGRYKRASRVRACLYLGRDLECAEYIRQTNEAEGSYALMQPTREKQIGYGIYSTLSSFLGFEAIHTPALLAGWVEANVVLSSLNLCASLRHTTPSPCTITALVIEAEISDS